MEGNTTITRITLVVVVVVVAVVVVVVVVAAAEGLRAWGLGLTFWG